MSKPRKGRRLDKSKLAQHRGGMSQASLASAAVVPLSCVVKAELRGRRTNDEVIVKLATALGVNENAILH